MERTRGSSRRPGCSRHRRAWCTLIFRVLQFAVECQTGATMQPPDRKEMLDRLKLIESMMAEGRRSTQRWGRSFLLWGIGPLIAMRWAAHWPHAVWAWPVTMGVCIVINGLVVKARNRRGESETTTMRSVGAVWTCAGVTVVLLAVGAVWSGMVEFRW